MLFLILLLSFISVMLLVYPVLKLILAKKNAISRLGRYIGVEEARGERNRDTARERKSSLDFVTKGIGNVKFLEGYKKKIRAQLVRAHLLLKEEEFVTLSVILFVFSAGATIMLKGAAYWLLALIVGCAAWFMPVLVLKRKAGKRIKQLNDQLGDAIVLISNSLKAGYSFFQAIDMVAREMTGPIAEEFQILQKEINFGLTIEKALENLAARVSSDDLELIVTAVLIQRQTGGNLAEVLDNISTTIRERVRIKGEIRTVTAQGRISGWVISLLPAGLGFLIYLINPQHMSLLFTKPLGIMIMAVSVMMELIGIFFIRKIIKIEV
jgi:tight adherence protein B